MKRIVLFLFFVLTTLAVSAQEIHFIPRVGLNLANTYPESYADMRPGLNVGIAGEVRFSELFAVEPGIYYSMQGYQATYKGVKNKLKLDYLNIPVYAKFYLYRGFHLFAGPQLGINIKARDVNRIHTLPVPPFTPTIESADVEDELCPVDLSIGMGAGYTFDMGLILSVQYNAGCTYIFKEVESLSCGGGGLSGKDHNGVLQFNVGWYF